MDAVIREVYGRYEARECGKRLRALFPAMPTWSIKRRAQLLGAATVRTKEPRWTPEEDALLKEFAYLAPERITLKFRERGWKRTLTSIAVRIKRFRLREGIDSMGATDLSKMFDIDVHAVLRWIKQGWLKAERRGTTRDHHDRWHITTEAIRAFLFEHYEVIELSKLERVGSKMWFLELISGGRITETTEETTASVVSVPAHSSPDRTVPIYGERVTLTALAEISGRTVASLLHRIDGLGMSVHAAAFGEGEEDVASPADVPAASLAILAQLGALMKKHRAKPADLARWTNLPASSIDRLLDGGLPLVSPGLMRIVHELNGDLAVVITSRP